MSPTATGASIFDDPSPHPNTSPFFRHTLTRNQTNPAPSSKDDSQPSLTIAQLQKTFEKLQTKAQPTFDKARFKAEAGLSRRGFVRGRSEGKEGLMNGTLDGYAAEKDSGISSDDGYDYEEPGQDGKPGRVEDRVGSEKDSLKWPTGEGWTPL